MAKSRPSAFLAPLPVSWPFRSGTVRLCHVSSAHYFLSNNWLTAPSSAIDQSAMYTSAQLPRITISASASGVQAPYETDAFNSVVMTTYGRFPLTVSHGKGVMLYDDTGKAYIDCAAGIATCTLGHADDRIADAVAAQLRKVVHVSNLYYIPEQGKLAQWLVDNSPLDKVFFCNSGAEANEAAIKLMRKYWHTRGNGPAASQADPSASPVILTALDSFHGRTLATITATGQPKYHAGFSPMMPGFEYVPYNDISALRDAAARLGPRFAGVLLEAMQGEGGARPGTSEYFAAARAVCDEQGGLLACDEVQVGVGRTGRMWGFEHVGVAPDILTAAKGLGGGVPIGAMLCATRCDVFAPGDHASTFGGNPLACAAALAVTRALEHDGVMNNAAKRGVQVREGLRAVAQRFPGVVQDVRGWGLINGVELAESASASSLDVVNVAMEMGLLLVPAGPRVVRFLPALVISKAEVELALETFEAALAAAIDK